MVALEQPRPLRGDAFNNLVATCVTEHASRYNEGRRLWSQIILNSRNFARSVWFHVPGTCRPPAAQIPPSAVLQIFPWRHPKTEAGAPKNFKHAPFSRRRRSSTLSTDSRACSYSPTLLPDSRLSVAVKHYLRGEEGCYYEDLWPLVKFLPAYALPAGLPSPGFADTEDKHGPNGHANSDDPPDAIFPKSVSAPHLPLPVSSSMKKRPQVTYAPHSPTLSRSPPTSPVSSRPRRLSASLAPPRIATHLTEEPTLLPSRMPPKFSYFDVFPFSLLVKLLTTKGKEVKGRKAARLRAKMGSGGRRGSIVSHNVPLEITLYLVRLCLCVAVGGVLMRWAELIYCCASAAEGA